MDNTNYKIRRDYAEGQDVFDSLSKADQGQIESVIIALAEDPWPKQFSAKSLGDKAVKIIVPVENDEITLLYDVDIYEATIDLIEIKRRGRFKQAGDWLAGLMKFEPKGK